MCWCPIVLRGIPPPHWWSGDSGSPDGDKTQVTMVPSLFITVRFPVLDVAASYHEQQDITGHSYIERLESVDG